MQPVPALAIAVEGLPPPNFDDEAGFLEETQGGGVVLKHRGRQAVQVEFVEGITQEQAQGFAAIALAPVVGRGDAKR